MKKTQVDLKELFVKNAQRMGAVEAEIKRLEREKIIANIEDKPALDRELEKQNKTLSSLKEQRELYLKMVEERKRLDKDTLYVNPKYTKHKIPKEGVKDSKLPEESSDEKSSPQQSAPKKESLSTFSNFFRRLGGALKKKNESPELKPTPIPPTPVKRQEKGCLKTGIIYTHMIEVTGKKNDKGKEEKHNYSMELENRNQQDKHIYGLVEEALNSGHFKNRFYIRSEDANIVQTTLYALKCLATSKDLKDKFPQEIFIVSGNVLKPVTQKALPPPPGETAKNFSEYATGQVQGVSFEFK